MSKTSGPPSDNWWIISSGRDTKFAINRPGFEQAITTASEYRVSALGRYLIAPEPITVERRLVGCEVHWKRSSHQRFIPKFIRSLLGMPTDPLPILELTIDAPYAFSNISDKDLYSHIKSVEDKLRSFDGMCQALANIDLSQVAGIVGICQDRAGVRSRLTISGDPKIQLEYVRKYAANDVPIRLERSYIADGLFELQGFDATRWDFGSVHALVCMNHQDTARACVLNEDHTIAFWLDDPKMVGYLQLFEYCLQTNRQMRESLGQCFAGNAAPMRLMFNQALEIDYAKAQLPEIFHEIVKDCDQQVHMTQAIKKSLNRLQLGVSLNSFINQGESDGALCTDVSVLQEVRALEPVREQFPEIFHAVTQQATQGEAGRFYLLDSIRGVDHDI